MYIQRHCTVLVNIVVYMKQINLKKIIKKTATADCFNFFIIIIIIIIIIITIIFFYLQRLAWPLPQSLQVDNFPDPLEHALFCSKYIGLGT